PVLGAGVVLEGTREIAYARIEVAPLHGLLGQERHAVVNQDGDAAAGTCGAWDLSAQHCAAARRRPERQHRTDLDVGGEGLDFLHVTARAIDGGPGAGPAAGGEFRDVSSQ